MSTSGWEARAAPATRPLPWTRLKTPRGKPAASTASANRVADSGANSDGLRTAVQPAASAYAALRVTWFIGQFHGVIRPQTPMGVCRMRVARPPSPPGRPGGAPGARTPPPPAATNSDSKSNRSKTAAALRMCVRPTGVCNLRARSIGAPISCEMACAIA
eukprot:scaffold1895_cov123-Isochrysis_galbana.AAC.8